MGGGDGSMKGKMKGRGTRSLICVHQPTQPYDLLRTPFYGMPRAGALLGTGPQAVRNQLFDGRAEGIPSIPSCV